MTTIKSTRFEPRPAAKVVYDELYGIYRELHDAFGLPAEASAKAGGAAGARPDLASLMKRLLALKEKTVVATA
jgi:L-ribulokinase